MHVRFSKFFVYTTLLVAVAATAAGEDPPHRRCTTPAAECERQIRQMLSGRRYLGALVSEIEPSLEGLVVKSVKPDSPAEHGGLAAGDRLMAINGKPTRQAKIVDFKKILGASSETGILWIIVARNGILKHVEIRMEPYPKEQIDRIVAQHMATEHQIVTSAPGQ
jgi:C-terminal processing protease CtpA/Prc